MNILILGAAGFIGTNLAIQLAKEENNKVTLVDKKIDFFVPVLKKNKKIHIVESRLDELADFDDLLKGQDIVYHLVSTTVPANSNRYIMQELQMNISFSVALFEACVRNKIKKVIFISSGGTVYGKEINCPLKEEMLTNPISSYGVQKITIEKLLYLYNYLYNLDYRIIRLANPYGPYQRPNGVLGAVTTFTYKALKHEKITVYGDGSVVRDYIYIDDAIRAILKIADGTSKQKMFNLGCGEGISIKEVLETIENVLNVSLDIEYTAGRRVDVPENYLDISRYEENYGALNPVSIAEGIKMTADFMKQNLASGNYDE